MRTEIRFEADACISAIRIGLDISAPHTVFAARTQQHSGPPRDGVASPSETLLS
jgi:hypothetical protein